MSGHVKEEVGVLRGRVLGAVGSGVGHHHQDGPIRLALLRLPEKGQRVVGDEIRKIVLGIVPTMPDL
jgi:hypothetical protein